MEIENYFEISIPRNGGTGGVALSSDEEFLIANCSDKKIRKYPFKSIIEKKKPRAKTIENRLSGFPGGIDLKGNVLAAADENGAVDIIEIEENRTIDGFDFPGRYIYNLKISPVNNSIIVMSAYKFFAIYDYNKGKDIYVTKDHETMNFDFMADGSVLVKSYHKPLTVISTIDGSEEEYNKNIDGNFNNLIISDNFKYLILFEEEYIDNDNTDRSFKLIDNSTREIIWTQKDNEILECSSPKVTFSKDGKFFAILSIEYISVWDIDNQKMVAKYHKNNDEVGSGKIVSTENFEYFIISGRYSPISIFKFNK